MSQQVDDIVGGGEGVSGGSSGDVVIRLTPRRDGRRRAEVFEAKRGCRGGIRGFTRRRSLVERMKGDRWRGLMIERARRQRKRSLLAKDVGRSREVVLG